MTTVEQSIDVDVPVRTAYNQWTQFEEFPRFMGGVERIEQQSPTRTHWVAKVRGVRREFDAEISEQRPDERIAWHSVQGPRQAGVVTFHRIEDRRTRVMLQMEFEPDGVVERTGDLLGVVRGQVSSDLRHFKDYVESRGTETGEWRGEVGTPEERSAPAAGGPGAAAVPGAGTTPPGQAHEATPQWGDTPGGGDPYGTGPAYGAGPTTPGPGVPGTRPGTDGMPPV